MVNSKKLRVFEAFSGYGSQSLALRNIGIDYEVIGVSEIDKYAIKSYELLHGIVKNYGDITDINVADIDDFDLFTYSFPCQSISSGGKQESLEKGSGTQSSLLWYCEEIIKVKKPKYLLLENVKNLVQSKHRAYFDEWLSTLASLGYTNYWKVINSSDHGIPQNRERVFVVSIFGEHEPYEFPQNRKPITLNEFFGSSYNKHEEVTIDGNIMPSVKINFEREKHEIAKSEKQIYMCDCKSGWQDNKVGIKVSPTLRANKLHTCVLLGNEIKKLNHFEQLKLMGLSENDIHLLEDTIPKSQLGKQAGNSIVVTVLEDIFKKMFVK